MNDDHFVLRSFTINGVEQGPFFPGTVGYDLIGEVVKVIDREAAKDAEIEQLQAGQQFTPDEMEAIRETLHDLTHPSKWTTVDGPRALHIENLRVYDLPESVIDWVLGGNP